METRIPMTYQALRLALQFGFLFVVGGTVFGILTQTWEIAIVGLVFCLFAIWLMKEVLHDVREHLSGVALEHHKNIHRHDHNPLALLYSYNLVHVERHEAEFNALKVYLSNFSFLRFYLTISRKIS